MERSGGCREGPKWSILSQEKGTYSLLCKYTTSYSSVLTRKNKYQYYYYILNYYKKNYKINNYDHINCIDIIVT